MKKMILYFVYESHDTLMSFSLFLGVKTSTNLNLRHLAVVVHVL